MISVLRMRMTPAIAFASVLVAFALTLAACGGSSGGIVVAQVNGHSITKASLDRWTAIESVLAYQLEPKQPPPSGLNPDPPAYTRCIAYLRSIAQQATQTPTRPTGSELKQQCAQRHEQLQHHILDILITDYWLREEGVSKGITVSEQEVQQAMSHQFPNHATLERFLKFTGETPADDMWILRGNLMSAKIRELSAQRVARERHSAAAQQRAMLNEYQAFISRWSARTSCRPGYVVQECRQYGGPKGAAL